MHWATTAAVRLLLSGYLGYHCQDLVQPWDGSGWSSSNW